MSAIKLLPATTPEQLEQARALFREYSAGLGASFCFQGFEEELATLPGKYASPQGCLLLAHCEGRLAGCVALRPLEEGVCEMKRLYVRPEFRSRKIGRLLTEAILVEARRIGFAVMRLDTLPQLKRALALYRSLGFREIAPYYDNPIEGVIFMELPLK
jgi:ribosomal protein S18 acetylase RimI-like enzyme